MARRTVRGEPLFPYAATQRAAQEDMEGMRDGFIFDFWRGFAFKKT
jgi:hypothetical protein